MKEASSLGWDLDEIQALIDGGIEERYDLEFKGAGSLDRRNPKSKTEITKDVSAMANSAGGTIIYGIAEATNAGDAPYAERIDPIDRSVFSSDALDQVIQSVQPKIEGIRITPIDIPGAPGQAVYVVTIPQSDTAHQAKDQKYHKRRNTTTDAMDDYEIRDIMNRSKHPKIRISFVFETYRDRLGLKVCVGNQGKVLARHVRAFIRMPMRLGIDIQEREGRPHVDIQSSTTTYCWKNLHYDFVGKSLSSEATHSGYAGTRKTEDCYITRGSPILPGTHQTSTYALSMTPDCLNALEGEEITWEAYADSAPVETGRLDLTTIDC